MWAERPLEDLIAHVIARYHAETSALFDRAEREVRELGGEVATALAALAALREDMLQHMAKEELVLFPWLTSGRGRTAAVPIRVMQLEHLETLAHVHDLRRQIEELAPGTPKPALEALTTSLCEHIQIENEVLFPRALASR